jgi:Ca2+-binding EF-hand superfamily protein
MDDDNSKSLDKNEFRKAVRDFKIDIPDDYLDTIFSAFDLNRDGTIDYDEFLRIIRGDLTPNRLALVKKAFQKLDKDGSGIVDIDDIRDVYNASKHPDVRSGKKTSDQVLVEFLETFEMHHNIHNGEQADGKITPDEFIEYYTNVSASLDNDEYFALMMNSSWNLSGDANTYKKYDKGWGTASPEKKNAFVGQPHQGYKTGNDPTKAMSQRMGMVSSENPLSTTTRYYTNEYDSARKVPSVANEKKNWGENRDHYLRTGVESANNPFAANG